MKLYYAPGTGSLAAHIALEEARLPYELAKVDLRSKQVEGGGDYRAVNEKGAVPALALDDGGVLTENTVVLQYIADQRPGAGLAPPPGTFARYRLAEWLNFIATDIHKGYTPLWNRDSPATLLAATRAAIAMRFDYVAKRLASTPYLMGDEFTVADAYLFVTLDWTRPLRIDLAPWPALADYRSRVAGRPAVRAAMAQEGLVR